MLKQSRLTRLVAILLGATALLFAIASSAERSAARKHKEPATTSREVASSPAASAAPKPAETTHDEAAEKSGEPNAAPATEALGAHAESAPAAHVETSAETPSEGDLTVIGINLEAIGFIALGALLSLALGAVVWIKPSVPTLAAATLFGAGFAVLDVVEARHQLKEARSGLAAAAWVLFAAHLAIAAAAASAAPTRTTG